MEDGHYYYCEGGWLGWSESSGWNCVYSALEAHKKGVGRVGSVEMGCRLRGRMEGYDASAWVV
jgi:hypothetical protein